jgi:leader peptidase (prepilin peptidase)/N-methyltransferase
MIGSAIGSFLNVVIYRLPRGMSLSKPGSHCPQCGHAIRWYHNLPMVGWLLLGGRCYDCKAPISPRYPLVELAVAAMFVALATVDVYLPIQAEEQSTELHSAPPSVQGLPLLTFAAHAWLGCSLLAAVLIRWDGKPAPWRLVLPALFVAAAAPFLDGMRRWAILVAALILVVLVVPPRSKKPPASAGG